jgi:hypothetical protein
MGGCRVHRSSNIVYRPLLLLMTQARGIDVTRVSQSEMHEAHSGENALLISKIYPSGLACETGEDNRRQVTARPSELSSENLCISANHLFVPLLRHAMLVNACSKRRSIEADAINNFDVPKQEWSLRLS